MLDLNSRLNKYDSLETLKIRNIIVQCKNIDFWITNNTKKNRWKGNSVILFSDRIFNNTRELLRLLFLLV